MKKLITAAMALALAAGLASAQVTGGDNIVGYVTITNTSGTTYPSYGNCFVTVGNTSTSAVLGDITAEGMNPFGEYIQFLSPVDVSTILTATYFDSVQAPLNGIPQGWYDFFTYDSLDDTPLPAGTGFLGNFGSGNPVVITFAGEVVQDTIELDMTGLTYPMLANTVPADLTLGDITAEGMNPFGEYIQFLSPVNVSTTLTATYFDSVQAPLNGIPQGWYDFFTYDSLDDTPLPAGTGFLGNFGSGNPVTIGFPNPVAP